MQEVDVSIFLEEGAMLPTYGTEEAAGADLYAFITDSVIIAPGMSALIPTGVKLAIAKGYEVQIRPRSGLALKSQITVLNSPGTIDSDYRGEIKVILINHGINPFEVTPKMRLAQMILAPVYKMHFLLREELTTTVRGEGGFGHTGTH